MSDPSLLFRARCGRLPHGDEFEPAMSFEEIGLRLGISQQAAHQLYKKAMNKIRERPVLLARLRSLMDELERIRAGQGQYFAGARPSSVGRSSD